MPSTPLDNPSLVTAIAQAKNSGVILNVVDESLKRAAEAREAREKREAEQREKDERDARAREYARREERAAEDLHDLNQREARETARREAEAQALHASVVESYRSSGRLDVSL